MRCLIRILSNVLVVFCLFHCFVGGKRLSVYNYPFFYNFMGDMGHEKGSYQNNGIDRMSTSLLHDAYALSGPSYNLVLSPISIWMILAMLWEGAAGVTENELKRKLGIFYGRREEGRIKINSQYARLKNIFQARNTSTEFTTLNFFISNKMKYISPEYENIIRTNYDGEIFRVDERRDKDKYARLINSWAIVETGNRIRSIVTPG